jgi:hypothetical protein
MAKSLLFRFKWFYKAILKDVDVDEYSDITIKFAFGVVSLGMIGHASYTLKTTKYKIIDVKEKYMFTRNGFTEFMIIDEKGNHYNVTNSIWYWKWDSIEDWHKIQTNKEFIIKYYGWRIPVLGLFPNVVMTDQEKMLNYMSSAECRIMESELNKVSTFTNIFRK